MPAGQGTPTPWSYFLVRLLFQFVLKIFYGTIVVENVDLIPTGPCIVCANHGNGLTDGLLLAIALPPKVETPSSSKAASELIPPKKYNMLRLTGKSTLFGKRTFTSWLIESAGTIPIQRRKDFEEGNADNGDTMLKFMEALEMGDAICLFPEGMSRYHPSIAPLRTGVARIVSDVLTRNREDPSFSLSILTCSITYMHRQHFRSDVLVTFNAPLKFNPVDNPELLAPVDHAQIRLLTSRIYKQISSGTFDSPSWELIRVAKLAARIYAPLGTSMSLGDHVRIVRAFLEGFKSAGHEREDDGQEDTQEDAELLHLSHDLKAYQDQLSRYGIKDDRIRRPLRRRVMFFRILVRLSWFIALFTISLPGLMLWFPVFATSSYGVHNLKKSGPIWNTWDEITQYKLVYGFISGICVWLGSVALTLPFTSLTFFIIPILMWMTLRWLEDAISAFRAFSALVRLLLVGAPTLRDMREKRKDIHKRVMDLAVNVLNLPDNPESVFLESGEREKGRVRGRWESGAGYFSVRRRRKRDWNETLRLYDKVDYPEE